MIIGLVSFILLGLALGSFLNVLCYRLYHNLSLQERSFCPHCQKQLKFWDLIPVVSFFCLRSRCRFCQQSISWQYPGLEVITALLFAIVYWQYPDQSFLLLRNLFFILVLLLLCLFDLKYLLIPDKIIWTTLPIALAFNLYFGIGLINLFLASGLSLLLFGSQYLLTRGHGIGLGDLKLGLLLGVILGWPLIIYNIILAYAFGAILGIILLLSKKKHRGDVLPLGAFLSGSAIIVLLGSKYLLNYFFL